MELVKLDDSILENFIPADKQVVIAITDKPLKDLTQEERKEAYSSLNNILLTSYHFLGYNIPGNNKEEQAAFIAGFSGSLMMEFINEFPNFSISDIRLLIHNGIREKYGSYMGFNGVTIHKFAKAYSEKRSEVMVRLRSLTDKHPTLPVPSEKEWDEKMLKRILEEYDNVKAGKEVIDFGNIIYNYLVKKSIIDKDYFNTFTDKAIECIKDKENPRIQHTSSSAAIAMQIIRDINNMNADGIARINVEAKRLAVKTFLSDRLSSDDLVEIINL